MVPLQNTNVHLIIKLLHADTRSGTDKPLTAAAGFLLFIRKMETRWFSAELTFALYKNTGLMALI